jgi:predicted O-methyltransferase YrrM
MATESGWVMNMSRSSQRYYWQRVTEAVMGESSTYELPTDPETVRLAGLAPGPRDDSNWKLSQLEVADRAYLWKCAEKNLGLPPGELPAEATECFAYIRAALAALPPGVRVGLWNSSLGAFVVPCETRGGGLELAKYWREHGAHTRKGQWTDAALMPNPTIAEAYRTSSVWKLSGERRKISSAASPLEGMNLYRLVRDNGFRRTAEVGMAGGLSTLYILQGMLDAFGETRGASAASAATTKRPSAHHHVLPDSTFAALPPPPSEVTALADEAARSGCFHVSIDPFQLTQWEGAARAQVHVAGLAPLSVHIMSPSHIAMPLLEKDLGSECLDLVFVDGMHLFDYTLVDLFCADRLTRVGGVIVLDDVQHDGVHDCVAFVKRNYPHWELMEGTACERSALTWTKTKPDLRKWNDHVPFGGECVAPRHPSDSASLHPASAAYHRANKRPREGGE